MERLQTALSNAGLASMIRGQTVRPAPARLSCVQALGDPSWRVWELADGASRLYGVSSSAGPCCKPEAAVLVFHPDWLLPEPQGWHSRHQKGWPLLGPEELVAMVGWHKHKIERALGPHTSQAGTCTRGCWEAAMEAAVPFKMPWSEVQPLLAPEDQNGELNVSRFLGSLDSDCCTERMGTSGANSAKLEAIGLYMHKAGCQEVMFDQLSKMCALLNKHDPPALAGERHLEPLNAGRVFELFGKRNSDGISLQEVRSMVQL